MGIGTHWVVRRTDVRRTMKASRRATVVSGDAIVVSAQTFVTRDDDMATETHD